MRNNRTKVAISSIITLCCMLLILSLTAITRGKTLLTKKLTEQTFVENLTDYSIVSKKSLPYSTVEHQYLLSKDDQLYYGFILKPKNNLDGLFAIFQVTGSLLSVYYLKPSIYDTKEEMIKNYFNYGLPFISSRVSKLIINPTYRALYQAYNLIVEETI